MEAQTQEKTDNELIAEFMGGITFDKNGICTDTKQKYSWRPGCYDILRIGHLQYHNSWDWLMPVVKKICRHNSFDEYVETVSQQIEITLDDMTIFANIEMVVKGVIDFIKWYNQTKKP